MAAGHASGRCPSCGELLVVPPPIGPGTAWWICPRCHHVVPVVPPRDPPPLFSWEVYPHVYPPLPRPSPPRPGLGRAITGMLLVACVLLAGLGVLGAVEGGIDLAPAHFTLTGRVLQVGGFGFVPPGGNGPPALVPLSPLPGAEVSVLAPGGSTTVLRSNASGWFELAGLPAGQTIVNVSASGEAPASYAVFFSVGYATAGTPDNPLEVGLVPAPAAPGNATAATQQLSPFGDVEGLVATLWSASVLCLLGAGIVLSATVAWGRRRRDALPTAAGATTAVTPLSFFLLPVAQAFPWLGLAAVAVGAFGVVVAALGVRRLIVVGWAPEPE